MSSLHQLQCLFCNHLNPAGASFCNECGSPLHLRPCDRCGAIEKRGAGNCYKCGAELTLPDTAGLLLEHGEQLGTDVSVSTLYSALATLDKQSVTPALNDSRQARNHNSLPESAAQMLRRVDHDVQFENLEFSEREGRIAGVETAGAKREDQPVSSARDSAATGSRRKWRFSMPSLLVVAVAVSIYSAIALSVYYYQEQFIPRAENQGLKLLAPSVSKESGLEKLTSSVASTPLEAASEPADKAPKLATSTEGIDQAISLAPPGAGNAMTKRSASATNDEVKPRPHQQPFSECTEAVAALGFCSSITTEGNR